MSRGGYIRLASAAFALVLISALAVTGCGPKDKKVKTASGLVYEDIKVGNGAEATAGKTVTVNYTLWLKQDASLVDTKKENAPLVFQVGLGHTIKGLDEGVLGMKVGGIRKLTVPPELGFGSKGAGNGYIPPNQTLTFEVELMDVK